MAKDKILVVDDEPDVMETVKAWLRLAGYKVLTASRGKEALVRCRQGGVDLVILDVR